jgi:ferredoxin
VDFESLQKAGAIMGSGGLVVLDDQDCMVDIARYFLKFTQEQSCGKCTFCRIGTRRMLDILDRLCEGRGKPEDIPMLETLAEQVKAGSICGLGKTAPNPVLSTLRYFHNEYEAHVRGECPAGKCSALIQYRIDDRCNGCSICVQHCPVSAIAAVPYRPHSIDTSVCTKCDTCRKNCPHNAITVESAVAVETGRL